MKIILVLLGLTWMLISCGKMDTNENSFEGTYVGYYHRNNKDTVQVSLLFTENQYSGFREKKFCPYLGKGTFEQDDMSISFENATGNSAQSSTPVLFGEYSYTINQDGSIRIWKEEGETSDEYILRKSYDESLVYGY
jgi:hypothetical protein